LTTNAVGQLVDLERQQRRGDDEGQVLGPALLQPQPDRLHALDRRVDEDHGREEVQARRSHRERLVDVGDQAVLALCGARDRPAVEVADHAVEGVPQVRAVGGEDEDRDAEERQDHEVQRAIDGDEAQHDLVAQGPAAQRQRDLLAPREVLAHGRFGRGHRDPAVAAQAAMPAHPVDDARHQRFGRPQLRDIEPEQLVARQAAHEQLPAQPGDEARIDALATRRHRLPGPR
jgi:hypothetical protein